MKLTKLLLIFIFSFVVFTACSSERSSSQVSDEGVASSSISSTTAVLSTTTSSTTTTVPTYTGPLYPQLFIDATDGESCSWLGGGWTFGPPGWGEYCDAGLLLLASNSDLCEQFGYVWSEELQRCERPESDWEFNARLNLIEDEDACIDGGGVWALVGNATFECRSDEGTIETAYSILNGEYEVIEAEIIETSELINKELKNADLPEEIRIGAILRDKKVIIPRSDFIFQKNDTVVFIDSDSFFLHRNLSIPELLLQYAPPQKAMPAHPVAWFANDLPQRLTSLSWYIHHISLLTVSM